MATTIHTGWFTEHRGWEDFCSAAFGVLIVLSPALAGVGETAIALNAGLFGVVIMALALLEVVSLRRWEEILELLCGVWIVASPFALLYGGELRVAHFLLGGAVAVLAVLELWRDRGRQLPE